MRVRTVADFGLQLGRVRTTVGTLMPRRGPALIGILVFVSGCGGQKDPPETAISWLAPQLRAAKPADCSMPLLSQLPNVDYQQIAIVEVSDDYDADPHEVTDLARRKACETGADALVILENQQQKRGQPLPGFSAEEGKDVGPESGANIRAREHAPEVGEVGHKGRFLDAIAIVNRPPRGK
jgi:hypothetical protein